MASAAAPVSRMRARPVPGETNQPCNTAVGSPGRTPCWELPCVSGTHISQVVGQLLLHFMAAWKPQGEGVWWILAKQVIPTKRGVCVSCSVMSNCPTSPWTVALQAPLSMEFSGQEHWSGLSFPSPGYLSDPGIKPGSPALQPDSLPTEPPVKPQEGRRLSIITVEGFQDATQWRDRQPMSQ